METFVYSTLNAASRDQDKTKIFTMGPLSRALAEIVDYAEKRRPTDSESLSRDSFSQLYRGLSLPVDVIDQYRHKKGKKFFLAGFISTS